MKNQSSTGTTGSATTAIQNMTGTIEDFDRKYTATTVKSSICDEESQKGMFETYGKDIDLIREIYTTKPKTLWTIVDGTDDSSMYIIAGAHFMNRVNYFVTNEEWENEHDYYLWHESEHEDDAEEPTIN